MKSLIGRWRWAISARMEKFPRPFDRFISSGRNLVGAEIGVFKGYHARSLLDNVSINRLYLVDPYKPYNEVVSKMHMARVQSEAGRRCDDPRVFWIQKRSTDIVLTGLDFVYIDGDHTEQAVFSDSNHWWPAIKSGGVLGGHDYHHANPGVIRAVNRFVFQEHVLLTVETPDWWVIKP